ncbi:MAG: OstA-like protein [Candidatus Cryptobacteroides sp.]|nr:OstA-like protein [Candidatus Cryptobacteroides sp.]
MTFRRILVAISVFLLTIIRLNAQEKSSQVDSLVRLLSAQSMELIEKDGVDYRKVTGPARFLHNDTYLICDTALWNVNTNEIFAISNVKILQDQTVLTGDRLTYYVDRDLAEFRGSLVQLEDKDHNILRTEYLDYNTRDSVAVFFNGGSMKDKEGQIIESKSGTYDSKTKLFTFIDDVNMFTDSIFVKSTTMEYNASTNKATFGYATDAWHDDNMLSSNAGWYDRNKEIFLFNKSVHGMSDTQEGWADSLFYFRNTKDIELLGNAQVTDTTRDMSALAGKMHYTDSLSQLKMTRKPAVIGVVKEKESAPDTVYFGADTLIARMQMMFQVNAAEQANSKARVEALSTDAVQSYRQRAAKEAAEAAAKAAENDPNRPKPKKGAKKSETAEASDADVDVASGKADEIPLGKPEAASKSAAIKPADISQDADTVVVKSDSVSVATDSLSMAADSLSMPTDSLSVPADSLAVGTDSLAVNNDSTKVNFITALKNVKIFKSDFQIACDSLEYSGLDSLVRLYQKPLVWNEGRRQYSADSLYAVIRNNSLQKASLMSNAFIIVQEDSLCFDQIRAAEMLAYFDTTGALTRFDALGDANAVFYLQEDSVYATVNKSEAKMLYATFKDGDLDRVYYFDTAKNDGYPVAQMTREERVLKGFNWLPDKRPRGKSDITPLTVRPSERRKYAARPRTVFTFTDKYFPGYMSGVYKKIEKDKAEKAKREAARKEAEALKANADSTGIVNAVDSLSQALPQVDSLNKVTSPVDSLSSVTDSLSNNAAAKDTLALTQTDPKEAARQAKLAARQAKIAAREAKWARLDSLDAAKAQAKADKKAAKLRQKKLKSYLKMLDQQKVDDARLEKYKAVYLKQKEREDRKAVSKAARAAEAAAREAAKKAMRGAQDAQTEEVDAG